MSRSIFRARRWCDGRCMFAAKISFNCSYSSHHAILDGWSLAAMLSEVIESYSALLNMGAPVAAPAVTYKRFVALEQAAVASEESRRFWLQQLEEFQATTLPRVSRE